MPSPVVVDLSHNALIGVSGDDAAAFLHGQLTNDVQALAVGGAQWNGWCSPKGRLLATFLLMRRADGYLLLIPAEIAAPIAKRLGMFVLRSKVKIEDASTRLGRIGIVGDGAAALVARHWGAAPAPMASIVAATQEAFVPQMANFDLVGGVSFTKGCYPGQEIVARTQYRGTLKRRMALAHVDGTERPAPGESVFSEAFGEQAAGIIVNAAPATEGGFDSLVVAQIESLDRDDLRWKSPRGPALSIRAKPAPGRAGA